MSIVLFNNKHGEVVTNKPLIRRVLKAYNDANGTEFHLSSFGYIEGSVDASDILRFEYKNISYSARYFSGCFYPYLVQDKLDN